MRAASLPPRPSRFPARHIHVIDVSHLADRREAVFVDATDFPGGPFHQRIAAFKISLGGLLPSAARNLSAASRRQLDIVNVSAERNRAKRQRIS